MKRFFYSLQSVDEKNVNDFQEFCNKYEDLKKPYYLDEESYLFLTVGGGDPAFSMILTDMIDHYFHAAFFYAAFSAGLNILLLLPKEKCHLYQYGIFRTHAVKIDSNSTLAEIEHNKKVISILDASIENVLLNKGVSIDFINKLNSQEYNFYSAEEFEKNNVIKKGNIFSFKDLSPALKLNRDGPTETV